MPILDLCRPLSVSDAALYAIAVIHYPRDLDEQAKLFARLQNALIRQELNKPSAVPLEMGRILQAAAGDNALTKRDNNRASGAKVCAHMFMRMLVDGVSLRSVAKELGTSFKLAPSTCSANWKEFRPAAHLGAAYHFWQIAQSDLKHFFTIAEELRRRGEAHMLPPPGKRLLDPKETWRVPEGMPLPPLHDTFKMPPRGFYFTP